MRDGNPMIGKKLFLKTFVVSLPMRDGNFFGHIARLKKGNVVSLPMRDGNPESLQIPHPELSLLAYL